MISGRGLGHTGGTLDKLDSIPGYNSLPDRPALAAFVGLLPEEKTRDHAEVVIPPLVNIFIGSTALQFAVSVIGVLVFTGLTAYDTQRIKEEYSEGYGSESLGKMALMGALSLYLNFINLFTMLLSLFGNRE